MDEEQEKKEEETKEEIIEDMEESGTPEDMAEKEEKIAEKTEEKFEKEIEEEKPVEEAKEETFKEDTHQENEVKEDEKKDVELYSDSNDNQEIQGEDNKTEELRDESEVKEDNPEPTEANESKDELVKEEVIEKKPEEKPLRKKGKEGSFMPIFFIMIISLVIAFAWDKLDFIKNSVHAVLDPSIGVLLTWNLTWGMIIIVLIIGFITTIIQKYATDQEALKELKKEQKILQAEMKKYRAHPEKVAELSKKQLQFVPQTFKLTSRAIMYTGIPFILFFRWFSDVFILIELETGAPVRFLGFLTWFWFYLIFTMIFSMILRKIMKVV